MFWILYRSMKKFFRRGLIESVDFLKLNFGHGRLSNPFLAGIILILLYFLLLQRNFLFSGDIFAEAFANFLAGAKDSDWSVVFQPTWAGYLSFLPFAFSKLYMSLGLPLGYIDYFFRFISVSFAALCTAFIAHPTNRKIVNNDYVRLVLVFAVISLFYHLSLLSFINTWYAAIIVIILVSLSEIELKGLELAGFVIFSVLIMLTRPMLPIFPFLVYYAVRTKSYISSSLITVAMIFSIFFAISHSPGAVSFNNNLFEKVSF